MCDPILVTLLKMRPHYSQSSRENATPSSGTSPLASYKEVPPPRDFIFKFAGLKSYPDGCVQVFRVPCICGSDLLCFHTAVYTVHQR